MTTLYDFQLTDIDGVNRDLIDIKGQVVLVVNVASRCGFTPQYAGLQALYEELEARGFRVLGVPANDFGAQEPGSNAEIKSFCASTYHVTFPMAGKVVVKGPGQHPLYQWLSTAATPPGDVQWNFEKFLIGRDGQLIGRFASNVSPDAPELRSAISAALSQELPA